MRFSNRAFGSKTTRDQRYHRSTFRIDTNHYIAQIVPMMAVRSRHTLALARAVACTSWQIVYLEQVAGRCLAPQKSHLAAARPKRRAYCRLAGLFSSGAIFDFLVSKIGQE